MRVFRLPISSIRRTFVVIEKCKFYSYIGSFLSYIDLSLKMSLKRLVPLIQGALLGPGNLKPCYIFMGQTHKVPLSVLFICISILNSTRLPDISGVQSHYVGGTPRSMDGFSPYEVCLHWWIQ